jgi:acyl-CoA thioesterase
MSGFRTASAVDRVSDGRYRAEVAEGWDIAGAANGGYLLATAARAMVDATGRPDPVTVTGHYLSRGEPGPVTIDVTTIRSGRRFATASAMLSAGDRPVLAVLGTFGDLSPADGEAAPEHVDGLPPDLPAPEDCFAMEATDTFPPPFMGRVELRLHPDDAGFTEGRPTGVPRVRGWFRLRDDEPADTLSLLCTVDAFPPTIFNADLPVAWTPTVELTAHVRSRPAPGWLACTFSTRFVASGFLEADGEVWDTAGRLVAQSRQLALVPRG